MSPLPKIVIALGVVSLLTDVSSEMILSQLPALLLGTLGASTVVIGLLDGIPDAISAVLKQLAGNLSDRAQRRKPFVVAGYSLSTLVRPLVTFATSPWHAILVRAVDRVGKGLRSAPRDALIADAVPEKDAPRAYAFHRMMDHTGAILGPLAASALLYAGLSPRNAISAAWIPGVIAVIALALFVDEKPRSIDPPPSSSSSSKTSVPLPSSLRALLAIVAVFSVGVLGDSFILVRAYDVAVDPALLPIIWAVLHAAKVLAARQAGRWSLSSRASLVAGWFIVAAGTAILAIPPSYPVSVGEGGPLPQGAAVSAPWLAWMVWLGAVVVGVGHGLREPIEKALVRAAAPDSARGRAFGAYHLVTGFASLASGLAIGVVWQRFGGPYALVASAVVVAVAAAGLALFPRR